MSSFGFNIKPLKASGVMLRQQKEPALSNKVMRVPVPSELIVPLFNFEGGAMLPIARTGEIVAKNSMLARSKNGTCWTVTPESGRLTHIERFDHPIMGKVMCAHIKTGMSDREVQPVPHDPAAMTADGIFRCIAQANIIDETDGSPVHRKIAEAVKQKALLLVADCLDDTPYISSGLKTLTDYGNVCADGVSMVLKVLKGGKAKLAVYDPGGVDMQLLMDKVGFLDTVILKGGYPAWFTFEREYCRDRYLRIGIQALKAVSLAVRKGLPQTDFMMTVAGDCVPAPANVFVTTGTKVGDVLSAVGLSCEPGAVIMGDAMTGVAVSDPDTPVFPGIRGLVAMKENKPKKQTACIGCGRCTEVCPKRLFPAEAVRMAEQNKAAVAASYGAERCAGCGACSAVCPSGIEITELMLRLRQYSLRHSGTEGE